MEQQMAIEIIRANRNGTERVLALKEIIGDRYLPIWIGENEADAIVMALRGIKIQRPFTHDLLETIIVKMGGELVRVIISKVENSTFYATIEIILGEAHLEIDARPSDAIALAVRAEVPIFADEAVLKHAGIIHDEADTEEKDNKSSSELREISLDQPRGQVKPMGIIERQNLKAFESFIESLNIDNMNDKERDSD